VRVDPYVFFDGRCAEAFEFYRAALGAEIAALVRPSDMPGAPADAGDKVMHAALGVGETTLLASDFGVQTPTSAYALSLQVADDAEASRVFGALADGGSIQQPLIATPFASSYGRVADRFGVPWIVVTAPAARA
jgi:PhnB protein